MLLPDIIRSMVVEYEAKGVKERDIGNGWCDDFARDVLERWIGDDWIFKDGKGFDYVETGCFVIREGHDAIDWDWDLLAKHWDITPPQQHSMETLVEVATWEPGHMWITAGKRHYDAESPEGVDSFFELKFFRRWLGEEV